MKRKNIALIGKGNWGKIIKNKLAKITNIKFVAGKNYKEKNYNDIDWVFILTPDYSHKKIIDFLFKKKINIFCEKPLVRSYLRSKEIYNKADSRKQKIYISDILNYIKKKKKPKKENIIFRQKKGEYNTKEILYRLAYHDFYLNYKYLNFSKTRIVKIFKNKKLKINIINNKYSFNFIYNLKNSKKIHTYNSKQIVKKEDPLLKMLYTILYKKVNYKENRKVSMFALKFIEKIINN